MQVPTKKILRLLQAEHPPEVRRAAALVLGELGVRDAEVSKALCESLGDADEGVRLEAIQAVGKLRVEPALAQLLERIKGGGEEAERAAESAARLGARGTKALQEMMPRVAPGLRRYIAAALADSGTARADASALAVLHDKDPAVVEAAVNSLVGKVPSFSPAQHKALTDELLDTLGKKKAPLPPSTEAAVMRLLAVLNDARAAAVLWDRILPPHPPEARAAALQALGKWVTTPGKDQLQRLFTCAADPDFRVAAPALMILSRLPAGERSVAGWVGLLRAPDVAVRRLALDKVGDRDTDAVVEALMDQIDHPDRELRAATYDRLTKLDRGRKALTAALIGADTADRAWPLAKALAPLAGQFPPAWRGEVFAKVCAFLEAGDRRADPLLFLLREADPADLRDRLEERALAWRKKKDYERAILYLRLLTRDPACGFPIRLELAACGLKVSSKELSAESRASDPCLHQFGNLWQQDEAELLKQLEKMKWLEPDDLYYLGFHFAEQGGRQRPFGAELLRLVVKRSPRTKTGQAAKSKLKSTGLD